MKHFVLIVSFVFFCLSCSLAQEWTQNLPKEKLENGTLGFFEIRNAFYDYWEPFNVKNGYYTLHGERVKAPYYKQFKRWEWYWEIRVDPQTGEFPDMSTLDAWFSMPAENSSNSGNWTSLGPDSSPGGYAGLGRLNCVAFVPGSTTEYYAGAASGGIWHTTNDGANWTVLNDTVPVLGVSDILVVDPVTGPDILYIATGDRDVGALWSLGGQQNSDNNSVGILKSSDGGATWTNTSLSFSASQKVRLNRLLMDPNSANQTMYAATTQGVYKTTDAWASKTLLTTMAFIDMEFKPGDPTTIYGSTKGSPNTFIYRSVDSGANWTMVATYSGQRTELAVSANQPTWVYAVTANSSGALQGVDKSVNSGSSFSTIFSSINLLGWACDGSGSNGQGFYDLCIAADPNNANILFLGGINTWKSTDGGLSFNIVNHWTGCGPPSNAQNVHADKHFLAFQGNSSTLFECNDGGLYKTTNGGGNWSHLSSGMVISQIYRLGVGQTNAGEVIIGLQDNGTKARLSGTWNDVIGGDGFECIIDYTNQNTQYGALYYGSIYKTTNYWGNSTNITNALPGSGAWCTPYLMDPTSNQTLYVGYEDVWKTSDQGNNWTQISNQGSSGDFRNMAISASNPSYIYAATLGNIYRTTTGGGSTQSWNDITSNLPVSLSNITYISVKDDDPDHVWVSMGEYNSDGVYETTNGGTSWSNISAGLPQIPVMCVIQNKQYAPGIELYAATDAGVFVKRDGDNWQTFHSGLPNVVVTELEIYYNNSNPDDSKIYAATYGRGVWQSDLYSPYMVPIADFTADTTSGIAPLTVSFTDLSVDSVNMWLWDFGDGNSSNLQHPQHEYTNPGLYTVALTATGPGGSDTHTKTDYIDVHYAPPTAGFVGTPTSGTTPLAVTFIDLSTDSVNTWSWNFGDGASSLVQNPAHLYQIPGTYTVSLSVTGPGGNDLEVKTDYITVSDLPPVADFSGDPTSGNFPLLVSFTDESQGPVTSYTWYFGDGETSGIQHPGHTYQNSGNYTVSLKTLGPGGTDSISKIDYITVMVGIEDLNTKTLSVYPNPCKHFLLINSEVGIRSVGIADIIGNMIYEETILCQGKCEKRIDTRNFNPGIYFCRIVLENGKMVLMKVLKE
ncbi:MAG: PKD domain-containing protein [Bacteroidales bacterium]|nr:PKD domain-containing protein [Bacteroidales bacterium]